MSHETGTQAGPCVRTVICTNVGELRDALGSVPGSVPLLGDIAVDIPAGRIYAGHNVDIHDAEQIDYVHARRTQNAD